MSEKERIRENVLSNRNYRLVFLGALISELGALIYSFVVSFHILELTGNSASLQGLYLGLCGFALLIFTPVGGVLGDRFNKAAIMYVCDLLKGGLIILATLMMTGQQRQGQLIILFLIGILGNAVSGIFSPAANSLLPHIVREDQLQQANACFSIKTSLVNILGIILAGILYGLFPVNALFLLVGFCYAASGISEMLIRYEHQPSDQPLTLKLAVSDMREGIVYLKGRRSIVTLLAAILFINFFITPVTGNFMPYFIRTDLANAPSYFLSNVLTPELWSSVFSVFYGVSSLLAAAFISAEPAPEKCGHRVALNICALAGVIIVLTGGYWLLVDRGISLNGFLVIFCLTALAMGVLLCFINIPITTVMMRIIDRDMLSKVTSITSVGSQGMIPLASLAAGVIIEALGVTSLLALCATGFTVTALLLLSSRSFREL
ncbi:MAG: MFS transporter [Erysipelotrichaceae bacterium]|nr:MFS transporter [Erysipelotrichaceae bacterium]